MTPCWPGRWPAPDARATVVGHTRWASVGHHLRAQRPSPQLGGGGGAADGPYVDRRPQRRRRQPRRPASAEGLRLPAGDHHRRQGHSRPWCPAGWPRAPAWRRPSAAPSPASRARSPSRRAAAPSPTSSYLALCGSGQSLYIGLAEDAYVVASEPYGLVEETAQYVRMDGETTQGQVVVLRRDGAGEPGRDAARPATTAGRFRCEDRDVVTAEITTRDIDRADFPHFLLKELTEAPASFRKTLRGRIGQATDGRLAVRVGEDAVPPAWPAPSPTGPSPGCWSSGRAPPRWPARRWPRPSPVPARPVAVTALPATELSGFGLSDDMSDTLVVAISQSGTTTDTNRTVDLARTRGAHVVAVVNRRNSDLAAKAHGVLLHLGRARRRDERGVDEGVLRPGGGRLAAGGRPGPGRGRRQGRRRGRPTSTGCCAPCGPCPTPWSRCWPGGRRSAASPRPWPRPAATGRWWAAAPIASPPSEVRIKLSELCYRSIASDATEDKKHIDLSCEPLILVCAAGLRGPNADDVAKEVAIYRAHKAAPVVVGDRGRGRPFPGGRPRRGHGAGDRPGPGLRAVGHGRPPVRLRGRPVHRRPGPSAARGPGGHRGRRSAPGPTIVIDRLRPELQRADGALPRRPAGRAATTATWRPPPPCGWCRCCATPPACCRSRATSSSRARSGCRAR